MEFFFILAFIATLFGGFIAGTNTATFTVREETIIFCNQKKAECAKEFQFYQLKKEVETVKENQK